MFKKYETILIVYRYIKWGNEMESHVQNHLNV